MSLPQQVVLDVKGESTVVRDSSGFRADYTKDLFHRILNNRLFKMVKDTAFCL